MEQAGSRLESEPLLPISQYVAAPSRSEGKKASDDGHPSAVTPLKTAATLQGEEEDQVEVPEEWGAWAAQSEARSSYKEATRPVSKPMASPAASPRAATSPRTGSKRPGARGTGKGHSSSYRNRRDAEEEGVDDGRVAQQYGSDDDLGLREQTYLTEQVAMEQQRARTQGRTQSQQAQHGQPTYHSVPGPHKRSSSARPVDYSEYALGRPSQSPKHSAVSPPPSSPTPDSRASHSSVQYQVAVEQAVGRSEGMSEAQPSARGRQAADTAQAAVPSAGGERDIESQRRGGHEGKEAPGSPRAREERRRRSSRSPKQVVFASPRGLAATEEVVEEDLVAEGMDEGQEMSSEAAHVSDPRVNRRKRRSRRGGEQEE